ncbi:MAG: GHMP kinase [Candidatus Latescibacteria bacterium]|jgi:D-glycero-alpha-D-manno-heptose-7-phosphate kinase|nr:GHMP kinase [Candidatus Latescibacterota bacterium]
MIITQTPLRISFAGGLTDIPAFYEKYGGCVVSTTIDKYIFVIINERFDDKIYINYSQKEIVDSVADIKHDLVREAMIMTGVTGGVEITTLADVPSEGSGLGSSSSVTVGLLNALYAFQGEVKPAGFLAEQASEIEIVLCGKPVGKQDQYIAAFGGLRCFEFREDGSVGVARLPLNADQKRYLSDNLMLTYTERTRSADDILSAQKDNMAEKNQHVQNIKQLAFETRETLSSGDIDGLGELLDRGWQWKREMAARVSDDEIDQIYIKAKSAGSLGGKLCGAGAGGFFLFYTPHHLQSDVRSAVSEYRELPFNLERDGSKVIFNMRRYEWN